MSEENKFYIQNTGYCGNCLKWWRPEGNGYTDDLQEAWVVDKDRATNICKSRPSEDIMWPVSVARAVVRHHVTGTLKEALKLVIGD